MENCYRGSEWRRWEMHLHTPCTKKEDNYIGGSVEEKWNNFYRSINDYIDDSDPLKSICAIAITDYLSIDNYTKVIKDNCLPESIKLVLANVELRMLPVARKSPVNIHCIFSPDISEEIETRFFSKLKFKYGNSEYSALKTDLERLGRDFTGNQKLDKQQAYQKGIEQYVVSVEVLMEIFINDPGLREQVIIVISNNSGDGVSGITTHSSYFVENGSQLDAMRRRLYQLTDMIFSSSEKDISYFLGEGTDNEEKVKEKCKSLKPCIHGCDAHTNGKVFSPDGNKYCWIKADPTFEGLKQVLYEPKDRVRISSTIPETKQNYYVIDSIKINNNSDFSEEVIYFNDKLTCIIGGKSTGKSLLLHNIALAVDKNQVQEKQKISSTNVKQISDINVVWRDGISSEDKNTQRKIVYIPQTYLNRLSDEREETTEIDTIIKEIILLNPECSQLYQNFTSEITNLKQKITRTIVEFLNTISSKNRILEEQREIGNRNGIEEEINNLSSNLELMSKEYDVTEKEIKQYQEAVEQIQNITMEVQNISNEKSIIEKIDSVVEIKNFSCSGISKFSADFSKATEKSKEVADKHWIELRTSIVSQMTNRVSGLVNDKELKNKIVQKLKPKVDGNEQISKISSQIAGEKKKIEELKRLDTMLETLENTYNSQINSLANSFQEFGAIYMKYVDGINNSFVPSSEDLIFSVNRVIRIDQFSQKISNVINIKSFSRFKMLDLRNIKENELTFDNLKLLIENLIVNSNDSLEFKNGHSLESGLRELFTDWYNVDYVVKMDEDGIQEMSPGKKALVLLRLLISLAESKCPILIDQPEDDLDNRSIFDELINFIKNKKIHRQIIVVTHNANIVLGGDAELVIVANQRGKNSPNRKYKFEYRGGSIENNFPIYDESGKILPGILNQKGMQEHICEILEGGEQAFHLRRHKYHFIK